jgi:ribose transport system substrate-binding protein
MTGSIVRQSIVYGMSMQVRMKYIIQIIEVFIIILIVTLSIYAYNQVETLNIMKSNASVERRYHVALVSDTVESYGTDQFLQGIQGSLKDFDAVLETYDAQSTSLEAIFDMILLTDVDGVILKLDHNAAVAQWIDRLKSEGIFVVTVGNDAPNTGRDVYVGTNKYNMGKQASKIALSLFPNENVDVGVVLGPEYEQGETSSPNNFLGGIYDTIGEASAGAVAFVGYSQQMRAEIIVDDILKHFPSVGVVICTDPVDAVRTARVLVDKNKVGALKIIAGGETPELDDSLNQGIISATLIEDYQQLGYMSISYLSQLLKGEEITSYVNIPIEIRLPNAE